VKRTGPGAYTLRARVELGAPLDEVFAFFLAAENLEELTPPWLRFGLLGAPPQIRQGTLIDYRLRLHGVPIRWRSEITLLEPPHRFVDEQRRGPFRTWHHEHRFAALTEGRTRVEDEVLYRPPLGAFSNRLLVERDLRGIFEYRRERMLARYGT
jgi:ligand-binding SRPBCC domain-containing protein